MIDRRAALLGLLGIAGAGASLRWSPRRGAVGGYEAAAAPPARAQPPIHQRSADGLGLVSLAQIPIGGGGFVTGIDASTDGSRLACRTDVANAYIRDSGEAAWRPLFSPSTMSSSDYDPLPALNGKGDGEGVAGIRIAPSDKNIIVASFHGYIWRSVDGGRSIRRTRLAQKSMPANAGAQRLYNRTIDIHWQDPRSVIIGTYGEGAWFTSDGGEQWQAVQVPQPGKALDGQPGISLALFDPSSPARAYVFVTGVGLLCADEGPPGAFRKLPGGPAFCSNFVIDASGTAYLCEPTANDSGRIWRYSPGSGWASGKPEHEAAAIAIDPAQPQRIIASNANGYFMTSNDRGANWRSIGGASWEHSGGEVSWTRGLTTFYPAELLVDPRAPGRLWVAEGVGVASADVSPDSVRVADMSAGIEELCAVSAMVVPSGKTFLSAWDKSFWRVDSMGSYANVFRYPRKGGRTHKPDLVAYGSYMDYAGDDPNFVVGVIAPSEDSAPGYTADGGETWQAFAGAPATGWGLGGCIAASTKLNFVLLPSNNGIGAYTLDGGKSWSPVTLDGVNPTGGFANSYFVTRKNISADKTRPGTFALVYTVMKGNDYGEPLGGFWRTQDGGRSWKQVLKGVIGPDDHDPRSIRAKQLEERQFWQCQLDFVPGQTGELLYTPHADYADDRLYWSTDDGANWTELHPSIRNVKCFGFGKAAPGQSRPALYFWGKVGGTEGLYAWMDWPRSPPMLISRFPSRMLASVSCVAGDPNVFGRVIVGTSCAGWIEARIGT